MFDASLRQVGRRRYVLVRQTTCIPRNIPSLHHIRNSGLRG